MLVPVAVRVLIADDERISRAGIRSELSGDEFAIVAEAADAPGALAAAEREQPDVVIVDLELPGRSGPELFGSLLERRPETAVVVLAARADGDAVRTTIEAGVRAYLLKDTQELDLGGTIRRVLAGESVIDPRASAALVEAAATPERPTLTRQELNVLRLVAEGCTNPEIASRLSLSKHTVKEYLSHAMRKLEVSSRREAVVKASRYGLLESGTVAADPAPPARELVYNESSERVTPSDLKIAPFKIALVEEAPSQAR